MFVGIASLMFIFFINYYVIDTIECQLVLHAYTEW
jgi:hypothetical protein